MTDMAQVIKNDVQLSWYPHITWLWCALHVSEAVVKGILNRIHVASKKPTKENIGKK